MHRNPLKIIWPAKHLIHQFHQIKSALLYLDVVDENLSEPSGKHVPGVLARSVADVGHLVLSLELPPHPIVNTLRFPPVPLELIIAVRLVARELLRALLDNLGTGCRSYRHCCAERLT